MFVRAHRSIREGYACSQCRASLRYRAQADAIIDLFACDKHSTVANLGLDPFWQELMVYEPGITGPFRKILKTSCKYYQSFYWDDLPIGAEKDGMVCQDLTKTTYDESSFDLVITSDIFEHIRKPLEAFQEIRRILRPSGYHIWSVPAVDPFPGKSVERIDTSTDDDIPLLPLVYHGSGMSGGRSVVYTDFGQDVCELLKGIAFPTKMRKYQPDDDIRALFTFISQRID